MNKDHPTRLWSVDGIGVSVHPTAADAGGAAAQRAAEAIENAVAARGRARVVFASAPSQLSMLSALVARPGVPWRSVEAFHMDEYVGIDPESPQSFAHWIADQLRPAGVGRLELIRPGRDPHDEARRYGWLVAAEPVDLTCMGIGVNGHIAFNEPNECRFDDPEPARVIELTQESREQQVTEDCFATLDAVPQKAITLTVPALLDAGTVVMTVSGEHKAAATRSMLTDPVGPGCPATALRGRASANLYLDHAAAADLTEQVR